jgi:hypothetical protein
MKRLNPVKRKDAVEVYEVKAYKPQTWKPFMSEMVYKLALIGANPAQIADFLKVPPKTVQIWINNDFPPFTDAYRRGSVETNMELVVALMKKAKGYHYTETTVRKDVDGNVIWQETTTKTAQPDSYALLKIAALRMPEQWREKNVTDVNINYQGELDIRLLTEQIKDVASFSDDELRVALKAGLIEIGKHVTE